MQLPEAVPDVSDETTEAARRALQEAGFTGIEDLVVASSESWPLIASFVGSGPDGDDAREQIVWLRRHLNGLVVAGDRATDTEEAR